MIIKIIITSLLFIGQFPSKTQKQTTGTITVQISGIEESKGMLYLSLYDNTKGFPNSKKSVVKTYRIKATKGKQNFKIPKITYGQYAISCFHDANSNEKLDTNFLGIPKEKVGTSNNPSSSGAPTYKEAKFQLDNSTINLQISLH